MRASTASQKHDLQKDGLEIVGEYLDTAVSGRKEGLPKTPPYLVDEIENLAKNTDLSINEICTKIGNKVSCATIGQIVKRVRGCLN